MATDKSERESAKRIQRHYEEVRERESLEAFHVARHSIEGAGLRAELRDVLLVALAPLSEAAHALHLARHPDSPSGVGISTKEAKGIADLAAQGVHDAILTLLGPSED